MTDASASRYKLYYYQATGRGNQIRLGLAAGGIPFEDVHPVGFPPTAEEKVAWSKLGGNSTTNVPMLQIDDVYYTQSSAVLRVVARKAGLLPTDFDGAYVTDKLLADAEDFRGAAYKSFVPWGATAQAADAFIDEVVPLHFGNLERQLTEGGHDFFVGTTLTIADVALYDAVVNYGTNRIPGDVLANFAALQAWTKRVEAHPGIAQYLASDQYKAILKFGPETLGK